MNLTHSKLGILILLAATACGDGDGGGTPTGGDDAGANGGGDDAGANGGGDDAGANGGGDDAGANTGTNSGNDAQLLADANAKLKECKADSPSYLFVEIQDDLDRCLATCVAAGSCSDLKDFVCSDAPPLEGALVTCIQDCPEVPADGYECMDGTKIAHLSLCDGTDDCEGGEDEKDCSYECADGEKLDFSDAKCDDFEDCSDGSDEVGCPNICG